MPIKPGGAFTKDRRPAAFDSEIIREFTKELEGISALALASAERSIKRLESALQGARRDAVKGDEKVRLDARSEINRMRAALESTIDDAIQSTKSAYEKEIESLRADLEARASSVANSSLERLMEAERQRLAADIAALNDEMEASRGRMHKEMNRRFAILSVGPIAGAGGGGADLSDSVPLALGTAAAGSGTKASRDTHIHPTTGLALLAAANAFTVGGHTIEPEGTTVVALAIKGRPTGHNANLQTWENPGNNNVTRIKPSGAVEVKNVADGQGIGANGILIDNTGFVNQGAGVQMAVEGMVVTQAWQFFAKASGDRDFVVGRAGLRDNMILGAAEAKVYFPGPNGGVTMPAGSFSLLAAAGSNAAFVPVIAKGAASQTANLQEWQDSAAAVLTSITSGGSIDTTKGLAVGAVTKTGAYTATRDDFLILADVSGGAFTVTLPSAANRGQLICIVKSDSGVNAVTVSRAGTDTINGATSVSLSLQYDRTFLIAGGGGVWFKISGV